MKKKNIKILCIAGTLLYLLLLVVFVIVLVWGESDTGTNEPVASVVEQEAPQDAQNDTVQNEPIKNEPTHTTEVEQTADVENKDDTVAIAPPEEREPVPTQIETVDVDIETERTAPVEPQQPSVLDGITIEPEYSGGGYERYSWRSSVDRALKWKQQGCKWAFYSATTTPHCLSGVDREHMVAFKEAFESGAHEWSEARQRDFYNDTSNLYVMPSGENRSKSDKDVSGWRPQNRGIWCLYASENIRVKKAWGLSIDTVEHQHLQEMLGYC